MDSQFVVDYMHAKDNNYNTIRFCFKKKKT